MQRFTSCPHSTLQVYSERGVLWCSAGNGRGGGCRARSGRWAAGNERKGEQSKRVGGERGGLDGRQMLTEAKILN